MTEKSYMKDIYNQLQELMLKQEKLDTEMKVSKKRYETEISSLKNTIKEKDEKIKKLESEVDRLKSQLNKDSDNSSNPPYSDIKPNKKKISNNRVKTDRKIGGQLGHKGTHLSKNM